MSSGVAALHPPSGVQTGLFSWMCGMERGQGKPNLRTHPFSRFLVARTDEPFGFTTFLQKPHIPYGLGEGLKSGDSDPSPSLGFYWPGDTGKHCSPVLGLSPSMKTWGNRNNPYFMGLPKDDVGWGIGAGLCEPRWALWDWHQREASSCFNAQDCTFKRGLGSNVPLIMVNS